MLSTDKLHVIITQVHIDQFSVIQTIKNMQKIRQQLYVTNRKEWRRWLEENHTKEDEVWLVYFKKHTGTPRIPYDDAVEEALCFGWIDSTVKRVDDEKYIQKFTPRKAKSIWSETNKQRIEKMINCGLMTEAGLAKVNHAKKNGSWEDSTPLYDANRIPPELKAALISNKVASDFYNNLAPSYKKQYNWWIVSAKREETREKRIKKAIRLLKKNKKLGI